MPRLTRNASIIVITLCLNPRDVNTATSPFVHDQQQLRSRSLQFSQLWVHTEQYSHMRMILLFLGNRGLLLVGEGGVFLGTNFLELSLGGNDGNDAGVHCP